MSDLLSYQPVQYPVGIPPDICDLFERLAIDVAHKGYARYSADAILHRIRWHHQVERGNRAFRANDHWTAPLARWFLALHPEHQGFFELRERLADGYSEAAE